MEPERAAQFDADVVVVGAGPVGLLLGSELALGGVSVQVLERATSADETILKAGSINLASAEILERRGLIDKAREAHKRAVREIAELMGQALGLASEEALALASRRVVRAGQFGAIPLDHEKLDPENPTLIAHNEATDATMVIQKEIERLLAEHAAALGVPIRRGIDVTGLEQRPESVTVHTSAGDIHARYVVACDGGRSTIRHAAGFEFPGSSPEITGRQANVDLEDAAKLKLGWNWSLRGVYRYGPMPGYVLTVEFDGPPSDRTSEVTASEIQDSLQRVSGTDVRVARLRGSATRWTDNARQASSYRAGRVLLAGDAAHVHSPFSGQGLNLGLGDATNLGWKLAATITGWAPKGLLDTYSAERHPIGASVLEWTRAQVALMRPEEKVGSLRSVVADLMGTRDGMTQMVNKISGVTQRVELTTTGPLIGCVVPDIRLADGRSLRTAFVDGRFVLLDQTAGLVFLAAASRWRRRTVLLDGGSVRSPTAPLALLARPDGVVVWSAAASEGDDLAGLTAVLRSWAGDPE
jgi:2-polyprenyl-6-methoxyphenol hydroxylase-like FAD-dependent oxidoreductase